MWMKNVSKNWFRCNICSYDILYIMSAAFDENTFIEKLKDALVKTHIVKDTTTSVESQMEVESINISDFEEITNFFNDKQIGNDYKIQQFNKVNIQANQYIFKYDFSGEIKDSLYNYESLLLQGKYENKKITIVKPTKSVSGKINNNDFMAGGAIDHISLKIGIKFLKKKEDLVIPPVAMSSATPVITTQSSTLEDDFKTKLNAVIFKEWVNTKQQRTNWQTESQTKIFNYLIVGFS